MQKPWLILLFLASCYYLIPTREPGDQLVLAAAYRANPILVCQLISNGARLEIKALIAMRSTVTLDQWSELVSCLPPEYCPEILAVSRRHSDYYTRSLKGCARYLLAEEVDY